ncbi:MAG: glycosyltransferase family 9 protein [Gemmataceae bacterium]
MCAVPAFRALRAAFPKAEISLIGLPWAVEFAERFETYIDRFIEFPGYPGLPEQPPRLNKFPQFIHSVQQERFDLALQAHGRGTLTNPLVQLFGARHTAGFFEPGQFCPDEQRFIPYPAQIPEVWRLLRLLQSLGIPLQGEELEFPVHEGDRLALSALHRSFRDPGEYIVIHPGARAAARRWSPQYFALVADHLANQGFQIVLTGTDKEADITQTVARAMKSEPLDLAGRTELGTLAALLKGARLLICNDTGVSHLAAALRVPSVVVFNHMAESEGWPPQDRQKHRVVSGIDGIMPEAVLAEADDLLQRNHKARDRFGAVREGNGAGRLMAVAITQEEQP